MQREKVNWLNRWRKEHETDIDYFYFILHMLKRRPLTIVGLMIIIGFFITAIIAPYIILYPGSVKGVTDLKNKLQPPSWAHPFGTDDMGADLYSRVVFGSRISLVVGIMTTTIQMSVGLFLGLCSGYLGGKVDEVIMRITDIFLSLPFLVLAILITFSLGPGLFNVMMALSITRWPRYARLVRGITLTTKEESFIEAAKMIGASNQRIIFRHILPNCISQITVQVSFDVGNNILAGASLGFLGLGAMPPTPEWGLMISIARNYVPRWWWYAGFPGFAIIITVLGFNLLGDGLRDILDPRLRR